MIFVVYENRITHTGAGLPEFLLNQMFGTEEDTSEEGLSLMVSRKLVKLMNGDVQYLRQAGKSSFIITAELAARVCCGCGQNDDLFLSTLHSSRHSKLCILLQCFLSRLSCLNCRQNAFQFVLQGAV